MKKFEDCVNIEALKSLSFDEFKTAVCKTAIKFGLDINDLYAKYGQNNNIEQSVKKSKSKPVVESDSTEQQAGDNPTVDESTDIPTGDIGNVEQDTAKE